MTNKIILAREDYTSNPDSRPIKIGGIFSEDSDMFFNGIDYVGKASKIAGSITRSSKARFCFDKRSRARL